MIVPSVTSRLGWPRIALARVDLPDPFGPIRAWMLPLSTSRLTPLRITLSSAVTCRLRISSSANSAPKFGFGGSLRRGDGGRLGRRRGRMLVGELDQLRQGRPGERFGDPALDPRPEQLRRAGLVAVGLMRAGDLALGIGVEAFHRGD